MQELVHLHGGRVWVESQPGRGSVFSFTLPLFSLSKILARLVKPDGNLPAPMTLITVELSPKTRRSLLPLNSLRQQCMDILRSCVVPGKDIVLPPLSGSGGSEVFMVLASADERGAGILLTRIAGQLERSVELQSNVTVIIDAQPVADRPETGPPLAQLEQQIATAINHVAVTPLGKSSIGVKPEFELILSELAKSTESGDSEATEALETFK